MRWLVGNNIATGISRAWNSGDANERLGAAVTVTGVCSAFIGVCSAFIGGLINIIKFIG